ncbi:MAG: Fe-S cluster assembly protein SufD [Gemmatales bacterium]|nr:MAG: Fe-S cluster assembly protein SufD [Gemmatales bacterium]
MIDLNEGKAAFLNDFERQEAFLSRFGSKGLHDLRRSALSRFEELGFPSPSEEEWRFTPLGPLTKIPFQLSPNGISQRESEVAERLQPMGIAPPDAVLLLNGRCARPLNSAGLPENACVQPLLLALSEKQEFVERHLGRYASFETHPFTALNTAFIGDGAFVYIPKNTTVTKPIFLVYWSQSSGEPTVTHPRTLIVAEESSQATIVEVFLGRPNDVYLTNAVAEVVCGPNASIDYYKIQDESKEAFHVHTLQVQQSRDSTFSSHAFAFGSVLARNEINSVLDDEGCSCTLNGLYFASGHQLIDNHTRIEHARPHCSSHELYKGILDGHGHGVFNGRIHVHPNAQKTDAKQTNMTLLLSDDAVIHSQPQLEIFADDVKCTHGATIGQLDADALFYLRTRGIGKEEARSLLTYAFANDIIQRVRVDLVRRQLEALFLHRHQPTGGRTT